MRHVGSYREWRASVDEHLYRIYCITIEDAGLDDEYLAKHWRSNESPCEFVGWFGNKHDLTSRASVGIATRLASFVSNCR